MNGLICRFNKKMKRFRGNHLDLSFGYQDVEINIFIGFFNFSYNNFQLEYNDNIDFSVSFSLNFSFDK